jgi:putative membrane-bound dehydrogenase-like protein
MKRSILFSFAVLLGAAATGLAQSAPPAAEGRHLEAEGRRLEVLFLGGPAAEGSADAPVERYRVLKKQLGVDGINLSYSEDLADIDRAVLDQYDAVLIHSRWDGVLAAERETVLTSWVEAGGGLLAVNSVPAAFAASDGFAKLIGGRAKPGSDEAFRSTIAAPEHPLMRGFDGFEATDQALTHELGAADRIILQVRGEEPCTWIRNQGKGRVFYTAYGSNLPTWTQPGFHVLLRRAILWSVGDAAAAKLALLKLPVLETEEMVLPGYRERKTITRGQKPLSPQDSMKLAQVPVGHQLALFASEPNIVNPIYIAWDHRGRAFVIETVDYPNNLQADNLGHDRITICEDTDGDQRADKFTRFAEKLSIPTALVFANGGVICTNGSEMLFLKDSDGDDKADVRQVLFDGFGMGDTHAGVSNLRYGFDHWIYGTVGYSGFNGTVGGEQIGFSSGAFRFKSDGSKLEYLQSTTNNTWGLGFTSDFDILGSTANGNPSWYLTFPRAQYAAAGLPQPRTPAADSNPKFFPSSTDIRQVDVFDGYTAAAGHGFYTAARFPADYRDKMAFVTEPTGKLVGNFAVTRKGAGFEARQLPNNLYNSGDGWSAPVQAETGPDGAVWISDWYNIIIQHNPTPSKGSAGFDARNGRGNAYETPLRDIHHGRIYRIYPKGSKDDVNPGLDPAKPATLLGALGHPNLLWRLHAQRLLIETKAAGAVPALKELVTAGAAKGDPAALHAFYALQGLEALDSATVKAALASTSRGLRRAAIAAAPQDGTLASAVTKDGIIQAADERELAEVFAALGRLPASEAVGRSLFATLVANKDVILRDATINDGWQMAARRHAAGVLLANAATHANDAAAAPAAPVNLMPNGDFSEERNGKPAGWSIRGYIVPDPAAIDLAHADGGRTGKALRLSATKNSDVAAAVNIQVKPGTRYRLGGWARAEKLDKASGRGAQINIHQADAVTLAISGTTDWTELNVEFATGNNENNILVQCLLGGWGSSNGTVYFDDLYLYELGEANVEGTIQGVASHFASKGDPTARAQLVELLKTRADQGSKQLLAVLGAASAEVKPAARAHAVDADVHQRGLAIYGRTCVACHGAEGKGVAGTFPPLDGASWVTGDPSVPLRIVLHGLEGPIEVSGQKFANVMPPHLDLKDNEIADVLTYVRQSWSNDAAPVTADQAKAIRAKYTGRDKPWTAAELKK